MKARKDDTILPLILSDSDDEESSQAQSKEVRINIAPAPINTLAILHKLERYEQLKGMNERLTHLNKKDWTYYAGPAVTTILGISVCVGYAYGLKLYKSLTFPTMLPNTIIHSIFLAAGIPTRWPVNSNCLTDSTQTNRHFRDNCFTFFLGRDDESSNIPKTMAKGIFENIYSQAGLFKRQLSVGKFELISNEKLAKVEMQQKQAEMELIARIYG